MDWKQKLQSARQAGEAALDQKTQIAIEENWPKVQQVFREKVGPRSRPPKMTNRWKSCSSWYMLPCPFLSMWP